MVSDTTKSTPVWLRRIVISISVVLVLLAIAVGTMWIFLKSPYGEALVVDAIVGTLERDGTMSVSIAEIEGDLPQILNLKDITVGDLSGTWLTLDRVSLVWRPWSLLTGQVVVETLEVPNTQVLRLPDSPVSADPEDTFDLDNLLVGLSRLRIETLAFARIETATEVVGTPMTTALNGSFRQGQNGQPELELSFTDLDRTGRVTVTASGDRAQTLRLKVAGDYADSQFSGGGTINVRTNVIDFDTTGTLSPSLITNGSPESFRTATLDVSLFGTVDRPEARVHYIIAEPQFGNTVFEGTEGTAEFLWDGNTLSVDAAGGVADLLAVIPEFGPLVRPDALYAFTATVDPESGPVGQPAIDITHAEFDSGDLSIRFDGSADVSALNGSGQTTVSIQGLGRLAGWTDDRSQTDLTVEIRSVSELGLDGEVSGTVTAITSPSPQLSAVLAGPLQIQSALTVTPGTIQISNGTLAGDQIDATVAATFDLATSEVQSDVSVVLNSLATLAGSLSGAVSATGVIEGPLDAPQMSLRLTSENIEVAQDSFHDVDLQVTGDVTQQRMTVNGAVTVAEGPLTVDIAAVRDQENRLHIAPLKISGTDVEVDGDMMVTLASGLLEGLVTAQFGNLALPSALTNVPVSGKANGEIEFSIDQNRQIATWTFDADTVRFAGAEAGLGMLTMSGRWTGGVTPEMTISLNGRNGFLGAQSFADVAVNVDGPLSGMAVKAEALSPADGRQLSLDSRVSIAGDETTIDLSALKLTDVWGALALTAPARLSVNRDTITLDKLDIEANSGRLAAAFAMNRATRTVSGSVIGTDLPFDALETLDPDLPLTGQFSWLNS